MDRQRLADLAAYTLLYATMIGGAVLVNAWIFDLKPWW